MVNDLSEQFVVVKNLSKHFTIKKELFSRGGVVHAVDGVSFSIERGEVFSIVGETGSGKTTTGKMLIRLIEPTGGEIYFDGENILDYKKKDLKNFRRNAQIIFQDPFASLNPRKSVGDIVGLPLEVFKIAKGRKKRSMVIELLESVGLTPGIEMIDRNPHEFSGGQRQRIGIARAIALNPKFIIADEPVASLDVSIRAQILNLILDIKKKYDLTFVLIAHDLSVVRYMSDHVMVMYLGKIMELAKCADLFTSPQHPYTKSLIAAIPLVHRIVGREKIKLTGEMPSPINPPKGCRFHSRCPYVMPICSEVEPDLKDTGDNHLVSCHLDESSVEKTIYDL